MGLVFDTETLAPLERLDALNAAFEKTDLPPLITCADGVLRAHRIEFYQLGPGVQLMRDAGSRLLVSRTARHVRIAAPEIVTLGVTVRGRPGLSTPHTERLIEQGHLHLVNNAQPYSFAQARTGQAEHAALMIDRERLDLPLDVVHAAAPALCGSPLYELVRNHFAQLSCLSADLPEPDQGRLGWATVQLVRALVTMAAGDARAAGALQDSLIVRVRAFVDDHLGEPGLGPAGIAAAHHVSVRHLYTQWSRAGEPSALAEWIMCRRLARARGRLATQVAQTWRLTRWHGSAGSSIWPISAAASVRPMESPQEWRVQTWNRA